MLSEIIHLQKNVAFLFLLLFVSEFLFFSYFQVFCEIKDGRIYLQIYYVSYIYKLFYDFHARTICLRRGNNGLIIYFFCK